MRKETLKHWFAYHEPADPEVGRNCAAFRAKIAEVALLLNSLAPDGTDKSDAVRKLRTAMQAGIMAIVVPPVESEHTATKP